MEAEEQEDDTLHSGQSGILWTPRASLQGPDLAHIHNMLSGEAFGAEIDRSRTNRQYFTSGTKSGDMAKRTRHRWEQKVLNKLTNEPQWGLCKIRLTQILRHMLESNDKELVAVPDRVCCEQEGQSLSNAQQAGALQIQQGEANAAKKDFL